MKKLQVLSPYDGKLIDTVPLNSAEEAEKMLQKAVAIFKDRDNWLKPHKRIEILGKFVSQIAAQKEELAILIAKEGGKPLVDARVEVIRAAGGVHIAMSEIANLTGEEIPMGLNPASENRMAFTFREPIGVVIALSAFNHPLNLIIHQVITAVAAGCPVIIKPAKKTPLSCLKVYEFLKKAGLPEGWGQVLIAENDIVEKIVIDKRVAFFSFIGSGEVGWSLRSKLAPGTRCALEHGGVAPVIVDETADIDEMVPLLVKGGFYHAGQVCVSVKRIFAPEKVAKVLAQKIADKASKLIVGDPTDEKTEVGPLISPHDAERTGKWVKEALDGGAEILCGGNKIGKTMYAPTVLYNPPEDTLVSKEEIFGPMVCVYSYKDRLEAIERANSLPYAFQASVFTKNLDIALDTVKRLDAAGVMVNDHTAFRVDWMPFGGRRASGLGIGGIPYTMKDLTHEKLMVIKSSLLS